MAYMNQEKKAAIKAELAKVMPKGWKYSLGVHNYSTIALTISAAPVNLIDQYVEFIKLNKLPQVAGNQYDTDNLNARIDYVSKKQELQVNEFWLEEQFDGEVLSIMQKIKAALNLNNHDNSDSMTDYFDVGYYVNISIGKWNKPFQVIGA